jgi:YegS/Rv2252/BmrU family lipid kinase
MRIVAIINPLSGAGMDPLAARRRVATIAAELERRNIAGDIHLTERAGHARELAATAAASKVPLVIVWGGDGTANEAGAALVGTSTVLGLVPAGSGNGLAAALGLPRRPATAIDIALGGATRAIDVGILNGRPFFNIAGVGFDAHVAGLFNRRTRGRRGRWPYVSLCIREGVRYRARKYAVQLDGMSRQISALLIVFANGSEFGMGARIAPDSKLDDGLLDAVVIEDRSVPARLWHARHLALGSIERAPHVILQRVTRASVRSSGPMAFHVDGEPGLADGSVEVGILPKALMVRVRREERTGGDER